MLNAILAAFLLPLALGQSFCPPNYIQLGTKCYYFSTAQKNAQNAALDCKNRGGILAEPKTLEENSLLSNQGVVVGMAVFPGGYWIGINDAAQHNSWVYNSNNAPVTTTDWFTNMPDGDGPCVHLIYAKTYGDWRNPTNVATWNDKPCETVLNYVCEAPSKCCSSSSSSSSSASG